MSKVTLNVEIKLEEEDVEDIITELRKWYWSNSIGMDTLKTTTTKHYDITKRDITRLCQYWICDSCGFKDESPQPEVCPKCGEKTDLYG